MPVDLTSGLNPQQREAVLYFDSPLLIVAGAGTGKTRVITHKIAYLVQERGIAPSHILGVTFTNKAAEEMKTRIEALTGIPARFYPISTFHSLGLRILRQAGTALGFDSQWRVIDDEDQKKIIEKIVRGNFPFFTSDLRDSLSRKIGLAKMNLAYPNNPETLHQRGFNEDETRIFDLYHQHLQQNRLWDFEDLISFPVMLLNRDGAVRRAFQQRFHYIVIDEFQDTNPNQYELIKLLAGASPATGPSPAITVVGDDDQAIYSWRGASLRFLFDFERDFAPAKIIKLEQNYRSSQLILRFANQLISNNFQRRPKQMWSEKEDGTPVFLLRNASKEEEAEQIGRLIRQLQAGNPELFPLAVLYRINSQSLPLENELVRLGIPFRIIKGLRFFERKEVKDSLALLRLAINPGDDLAFLRMIDFLPLGIGPKTLTTLNGLANQHRLPLLAALETHLPEKFAAQPLFAEIVKQHREKDQAKPSALLAKLLKQSGYLKILEEKEESERLLNINELVDFIRQWEKEHPQEGINELFDRINLQSQEAAKEERVPVFLLTMHNAKGLEFPSVVVAGCNPTYLPFFLRKVDDEIEEERRLMYVASTRPLRLLVVSSGSDRLSPFLRGISPAAYDTIYSPEEIQQALRPKPSAVAEKKEEGKFIVHPIFGKGKIVETIAADKYLVNFPDRGKKLIDTSVVGVEFL